MIEEETSERESVARKEAQWETEKKRMAVHKLKARFLEKIEVEKIVLYAFDCGQSVTSFRTAKLKSGMKERMRHLEARIETERAAQRERENGAALCNSARGEGEQHGAKSEMSKHGVT